MKYATEQRLRLIDFLLAHYGHVGRDALMDYFDIGSAQATRDFKSYIEMAPNNTVYSATQRTYIKNIGFKRVFP